MRERAGRLCVNACGRDYVYACEGANPHGDHQCERARVNAR